MAIVDPKNVKSIRILSLKQQFTDTAKENYVRFRKEMQSRGVDVEWKVADKMEVHDRYIIGVNIAFNAPAVDSIYGKKYTEALETPNRPSFEEWWEKARPALPKTQR